MCKFNSYIQSEHTKEICQHVCLTRCTYLAPVKVIHNCYLLGLKKLKLWLFHLSVITIIALRCLQNVSVSSHILSTVHKLCCTTNDSKHQHHIYYNHTFVGRFSNFENHLIQSTLWFLVAEGLHCVQHVHASKWWSMYTLLHGGACTHFYMVAHVHTSKWWSLYTLPQGGGWAHADMLSDYPALQVDKLATEQVRALNVFTFGNCFQRKSYTPMLMSKKMENHDIIAERNHVRK